SSEVAAAVVRYFGALPEGNWEGTNILHRVQAERARALAGGVIEEHDFDESLDPFLRLLLERRASRVPPSTDDKGLASWNGLAIQAFAEAGRVMGEPEFVEAAVRAADFVLTNLRRDDGRLLRSWRDGRTSGPAFLDDYAAMGLACLSLYETTFDLRWMREA